MSWIHLNQTSDFDALLEESSTKPLVVFKHSTRCGTSMASLKLFNKNKESIAERANLRMVDVIQSRDVSKHVEQKLGVHHESPQAILVENGVVVYADSHYMIDSEKILELLT